MYDLQLQAGGECGKNVEKMWKKCGKNVEKLWKKYGNNVETCWRIFSTFPVAIFPHFFHIFIYFCKQALHSARDGSNDCKPLTRSGDVGNDECGCFGLALATLASAHLYERTGCDRAESDSLPLTLDTSVFDTT